MANPRDDKLQTIAVVAEAQAVTIGHTGTGYTVKNTGRNSIFYRKNDLAVTFAGTAAVLTADPFFMAELKPGKILFAHNETIAVVCATGQVSTLSVSPYQAGSDTIENLQIERHLEIEDVNGADIADWDKDSDLAALASSVKHIPHNDHTTSIQIEKTATAGATALMSRADINVDASAFEGPIDVSWAVNGTNWTGVAYVVLRLGTTASHYNEWKFDPEDFATDKWTKLSSAFIDSTQTGNGLNMAAITYIALGVQMDTSGTTTAAAIQFDFVHFLSAPFFTPGTAIVVDAGNVANTVRVAKFGSPSNATVATDVGASSDGTLRTVSASDDPAVANLDKLTPTGAAALNTAVTTGVGTIDTITLTANTIYVIIKFDTAGHYATPGTSPPTTLYGGEYLPNITYRIDTFKTTNLYVESAGAAGAFHATCYTHA